MKEAAVKAFVVYESLWGNTAAVARAIAEGIGEEAVAGSTQDVTADMLVDADLLVAGAPIFGFTLPTDSMRVSIGSNPVHRDHPPDLAHPSMRAWLESLPSCHAAAAAFETRIWWSPGSSAKRIAKSLKALGCVQVMKPEGFLVEGTYGPLKNGELDRARSWGEELGRAAQLRSRHAD